MKIRPIKRPCRRKWETLIVGQLRSTTPILMKMGSLVDFDLKITYPGLFSTFGPVLGVILGSEGQKWEKSGNLCGHFSAPKIDRGKKFREHQRCEIVQKICWCWNFEEILRGAALRRIFIFQFFQVFIFLPRKSPPNFFVVQIGPIAHKISKIHHTASP